MDLNSIVGGICKLISFIKSVQGLKKKEDKNQVIIITNNINVYYNISLEK